MHPFYTVPYLSGAEMAMSSASVLMACLAILINRDRLSYRLVRLFFVTSFFTVFIFKTAGQMFWHVSYYLSLYLATPELMHIFYDHTHLSPYGFWAGWVLAGIALSFIFHRRDH